MRLDFSDVYDQIENDRGMSERLAGELRDAINEELDRSMQQTDYDLEPIKESAQITQRGSTYYVEYTHPAAEFFNAGTEDHAIEGDPLSFVWSDPPEWVKEEFEAVIVNNEIQGYRVFFQKVEVDGLPALRFVQRGAARFRNS